MILDFKCVVCETIVTRNNKTSRLICPCCRKIYPIVKGVFDFLIDENDYVKNYEQIANDDPYHDLTHADVKKELSFWVKKFAKGTTVDLGSADGCLLNGLSLKNKIAIDIAMLYLKQIPGDTTRIRCMAEKTPLLDNVADTIICSDLLEHVLDEKKLVKEIKRLLKVNGHLLLACPWEQDLNVYQNPEYQRNYVKYKYVHLRSINQNLILSLFPEFVIKESKLITVGMRYMTIKPYPLKFFYLLKAR